MKNWLERLNSDGHIAVGTLIFIVGAAIHVFHGLDAAFVAFTTTCFAFLGVHAVFANKGDSDDTPPSK